MTLLLTVIAATIATLVWYCSSSARTLKIGVLCYMYWGASLMWLVDAVFEYAEQKAEYFTPAAGDMLNDSFLGLSVIALGMIIWVVVLLVKDPKGVVRDHLAEKKGNVSSDSKAVRVME